MKLIDTIIKASPFFNKEFWYKNVIKNCTIAIKTFRRPNTLNNAIIHIRQFYPDINIFVVDDGDTDNKSTYLLQSKERYNIKYNVNKYWMLPFDTGISYGRNFVVKQVDTRYIFIMDDDTVFTKYTQLERLIWILEAYQYDLVGCAIPKNFYQRTLIPSLDTDKDQENTRVNMIFYQTNSYNVLPLYDFVVNIFMARTDKLKNIKWDEKLKICEHEEFFFRNKIRLLMNESPNNKEHIKITYSPTSIVMNTENDELDYKEKYRKNKERVAHFMNLKEECMKVVCDNYYNIKSNSFCIKEMLNQTAAKNLKPLYTDDSLITKDNKNEFDFRDVSQLSKLEILQHCYDEIYIGDIKTRKKIWNKKNNNNDPNVRILDPNNYSLTLNRHNFNSILF